MANKPAIQQISLSLSAEQNAIAPATAASYARHHRDLGTVRNSVLEQNDGHPITFFFNERLSPFNIAITPDFSSYVRSLHRLLDKALIDIVDRWYSDKEADFPSRMPLETHEDELMRWMAGPGRDLVPRFAERYGMWRTDYLVERSPDGPEQAKICEINARIPFNGFWIVGMHEKATEILGETEKGFKSPNDFETTRKAIFECFDTSKPMYHIHSTWPGVDSLSLGREYERRFGQPFITVDPSQLRVVSDQASPTGHKLFYSPKNGYKEGHAYAPQEIEQCALELFQEEYAHIDPLVLHQIATCCVNDIRNVFLVHDKRILGVIVDELPNLEKRNVLTSDEKVQLENCIAKTLSAGTEALSDLLRRSKNDATLKDQYIIKPVRDASCNGIKLGYKITQDEWLELLEQHAARALLPHEGACVVQEMANHVWYDIMRHDLDTYQPEKFHVIGSQHMINSKLDVHGPWRIGQDVHVGVGSGKKGIVMSCVLRPEGLPTFEGKEE